MKLEEAIEIVLQEARSDWRISRRPDSHHMYNARRLEAASVVEDFFVNNVFDGTED